MVLAAIDDACYVHYFSSYRSDWHSSCIISQNSVIQKTFFSSAIWLPWDSLSKKKKKKVRVSVDFSSRIVDPHCSWIQHLQTHTLTETYLWPQSHSFGSFLVIHKHVHSSEKFQLPDVRVPSCRWARWCAAFMFYLSDCRVLFTVCLLPCFLHFCAFCWWLWYLKWSPSIALKCYIVVLNVRRLCWRHTDKIHVLDKLCSGMS